MTRFKSKLNPEQTTMYNTRLAGPIIVGPSFSDSVDAKKFNEVELHGNFPMELLSELGIQKKFL